MIKKLIGYIIIEYLKILAKIRLRRESPYIIGITGSVGKTSTKEAIKLVLENRYKVKATGKGNSETGIPLEILNIPITGYRIKDWIKYIILAPIQALKRDNYNILIAEMGIDSPFYPKNMDHLLSILKPNIAILTNIGLVHSSNYDILNKDKTEKTAKQLIYNEKSKIFKYAHYKIIDGDDEVLKRDKQNNTLTIQISPTQDGLQILDMKYDLDKGTDIKYKYKNENINISIPNTILTESYKYTIGFAVLVGKLKGLNTYEIQNQLYKFKSSPGRSNILMGINNSYILDGSYNASPESMKDFISSAKKIKTTGNKILVMGDMRELGISSKQSHIDIAKTISNNFDYIYLVGKEVTYTREELINTYKIDTKKIHLSASSQEVGRVLKDIIKEKDLIIVKGSQNTIFLEECIKEILKDKKDINQLCRQGKYWEEVKEKYFNK